MPIVLIIELLVLVCVLAVGAVALVLGFAVGLVTHPFKTLALLVNKLAGLAAGLALILALLTWFGYDHAKDDFAPAFWGSIAVIVVGGLLCVLTQWFIDRPTRAERRAMEAEAAQRLQWEARQREFLQWEQDRQPVGQVADPSTHHVYVNVPPPDGR
jgi:peptidoglycan/LPS O-acetylase OafA/YrhL